MFNEPTNHPLIPRENNVMIEKKHVSIHTEDRDTRLKSDGTPVETQTKFSIQLPESLDNIAYVKLKNIQIPTYYINIAEKYRNNKFGLNIENNGLNDNHTITIQDGQYTPESLLIEIGTLLIKNYGGANITSFKDSSSFISSRLTFVNGNINLANAIITLRFDNLEYDDINDCYYKNSDLLNDYSNESRKWGLGYILGFDKSETFSIRYDATGNIEAILIDGIVLTDDEGNNVILSGAPNQIRLDYLKTIYLEVNDFNTISEKKPDIGNRNDTFNNGYYGLSDAALAKIPIPSIADGITTGYNLLSTQIPSENLETKKLFLNSFKTRISRLNITFRDHNGSLIDFDDQDFTFTLEFGLVREVPNRVLNILNFTD